MPHSSRERQPMRNKNVPKPTSDEIRLLGGREKPDPDGVPIVPGGSFNRRKQISGIAPPFRPVDTLSRGVRDSGPVPARGKEKAYFTSQARSVLSPPRSSHVADSPERSSKRRRVEGPETASNRLSTSDDDIFGDLAARAPSVGSRSTRLSPTLSQFSHQTKKSPGHKKRSNPNSEYWGVEESVRVPRPSPRKGGGQSHRFSSEDKDISFIRDATQERRRESIVSSVDFESASRDKPALTSALSVEIHNPPSVLVDKSVKSPPQHNRFPVTRKARTSLSRESPDELQGEATVRPVPASLNDYKKGSAATRGNTSPSDIRPTAFTSEEKTGSRKAKRLKSKKGDLAPQSFKIDFFREGSVIREAPDGETDELLVDPSGSEITVKLADAGYVHSFSLQKILKVLAGDASSCKIRLELSKVSGQDTKVDIELSSEAEKEGLCSLLRKLNVEVQEKPGNWIAKAFKVRQRDQKQLEESTNGLKRPFVIVNTMEEAHSKQPEPAKRVKLSDALQASNKGAAEQKSPSLAAADDQVSVSIPAAKRNETSNPGKDRDSSSGPQLNEGVEIPVKKYKPSLPAPARATRSMSRRELSTVIHDDDNKDEDDTPPPTSGAETRKWLKKPLVYPRYGKKKAEVDASDMERLAPHQFLNDNLIGFYIRFLEDHLERCNSEAAKRVYFFNSYFFATLTNLPRGKRGINYAGVQKWTRNVDLFSYDYVVVPINEDAHWYVAVICNLPYLQGIVEEHKPPASRALSEVTEVPETPEPGKPAEGAAVNSEPSKEETARQSLASMSLLDKQSSKVEASKSGDEEWPEKEEIPNPARTNFSDVSSQAQSDSQKTSETAGTPGRTRKPKKRQPPGVRYDVCQPIVITFDSLGLARSPTISTLREYLYEEAKSKRGVEIDKSLIKGMRAREVPLQPNYSDCGLYLLAYLEKFVQDPDLFIRKLLRKDMRTEDDWPPLRSGLLRSRLRKFIKQLYAEQEQLSRQQATEHALMVDQQPICYLLGSPEGDEARPKEKAESENSPKVQVSPPPAESKSNKGPSRDSTAPPKSPKPGNPGKGRSSTRAETQQSIINIDQLASSHTDPRTKDEPRQSSNDEIVEVPDSQEQANAPTTRATKPAEARSSVPKEKPKQKHANTVYVDDSDGVEECAAPNQRRTGTDENVEVQIQVCETPPRSPRAR